MAKTREQFGETVPRGGRQKNANMIIFRVGRTAVSRRTLEDANAKWSEIAGWLSCCPASASSSPLRGCPSTYTSSAPTSSSSFRRVYLAMYVKQNCTCKKVQKNQGKIDAKKFFDCGRFFFVLKAHTQLVNGIHSCAKGRHERPN